MKQFTLAVITASLFSLGACSSLDVSRGNMNSKDSFSFKGDHRLQPYFSKLYAGGEHDAVLNFADLGLAAMEVGEFDVAEKAFDQGITRIDAIYANNENAKKARSLWTKESAKDFKGEPYERAMVYYYRGLLYLRKGDYQNARASFLAAEYQDTVAEQDTYLGDFAVMNLLAGWSSHCDHDESRAKELYQMAISKDPSLASFNLASHHLALIDGGRGPQKLAVGKHREMLQLHALPEGKVDSVYVARASSRHPTITLGDVNFQATTRGGRPMDGILAGKAKFKDNADVAGDVAMTAGMMSVSSGLLNDSSSQLQAGALFGLIGTIAKIASASTQPRADTRAWQPLPATLHAVALREPILNPTDVAIEFKDSQGGARKAALSWSSEQQSCSVAWGRTDSALLQPSASAPSKDSKRDVAFRQLLQATF